MASTYVNNLRLEEIGTGEQSGTWGDTTNTNLEIIGQAVAWGTRAIANDSTDNITIADGALDADRCLGLKLTGGGQACTVSLLPNTSSKTWFMYNATAAALTFTCGSGANVIIPAGQTKVIATDGLGSGGVVHDLLTAVNLAGTTVVDDLTVSDDLTVTDDVAIGGLATIGETLAVTGVVTANAGVVVDNITIDGQEIDVSSGDLTLDVAGDILLNADGGDIFLADDSVTFGKLKNSSSHFFIQSLVADKDILIIGNDGGSEVTAVEFDMSDAGTAIFNHDIKLSDNSRIIFGGGSDLAIYSNGTDGRMEAPNGDLVVDVAGDIVLDVDGANVFLKDGGSEYVRFTQVSGGLRIQTVAQDADIVFRGNDNGGDVDALTLDMSDAGSAIFNNAIYLNADLIHTGDTDTQFQFSNANEMRLIAGNVETFKTTATEVSVNDQSADVDFRVETNAQANAFVIDGGSDTITMTQQVVTMTHSGNGPQLILQSTDTDSSGGPQLTLFRNSSSPADNDNAGRIVFSAENDAGEEIDYSRIITYIPDVSNGSEDGAFQHYIFKDGTSIQRLEHSPSETVFNQDSADVDFRVESDGATHMLMVDAGANLVLVGGGTNTSGGAKFKVAESSQNCELSLNATSSATDIVSYNRNSGAYHPLFLSASNITLVPTAGSSVIFNDAGVDADFRVESDGNANCLFVDGSNSIVHIGTSDPSVAGNTGSASGINLDSGGGIEAAAYQKVVAYFNRMNNDGTIVDLRQNGTSEGSISVSGSTVSYNGFAGRHESSGIATNTAVGTVVSTIDELDTYPADSTKAGQTRADHAKVKVSDSVGDARVYGVVDDFDENDKLFVVSVGIASVKVTGSCSGGDLLESNGDGTAKVQSDDIVRSKTIGKVTIGNSNTGVKLVSCVMYCG